MGLSNKFKNVLFATLWALYIALFQFYAIEKRREI